MRKSACALAALILAASSAVAQDRVFEVFFAFDRANLDAAAENTIDQAVEAYRATGAASIEVEGHTDTVGTDGYNFDLSQRRADAVRQALVARGVPPGEIRTEALGENDLAVQTGEGVRLRENRRVTIAFGAPPPTPIAAPEPEPEPEGRSRLSFLLAPYYGWNRQDESNDDESGHLAGGNLIVGYDFADQIQLEFEQAGFWQFAAGDDEGFGGRSAIGANYVGLLNFLPGSQFFPYLGANFGGFYGDEIDNDLFAGPEIGVRLGPVEAKVAYDMPFDRDVGDGVLSATLGIGLRF